MLNTLSFILSEIISFYEILFSGVDYFAFHFFLGYFLDMTAWNDSIFESIF